MTTQRKPPISGKGEPEPTIDKGRRLVTRSVRLTEQQMAVLDAESVRTGHSVSALIFFAVYRTYIDSTVTMPDMPRWARRG